MLFIACVAIMLYITRTESKEVIKRDSILNNNVKFSGFVIDYKQSDNHAFGIIQLQLTNTNIKEFNKTLENKIYPYRIHENIAELYVTIPDGLQHSDVYNVDSNSHKYIFESKKRDKKYTSEIHIIEDSYNVDFVKENTIFKY